ncbi:MAG: hypothetical protein NTW99_00715 [Chloroflexi bacterium]|nr:hypothetical protein [Chloroflexota bacterium]
MPCAITGTASLEPGLLRWNRDYFAGIGTTAPCWNRDYRPVLEPGLP